MLRRRHLHIKQYIKYSVLSALIFFSIIDILFLVNVLFLLCEQKKRYQKRKLRFRESSEKLAFQMPNVSSLGEAKRHQQVSRSYCSIVMRRKNSELATLRQGIFPPPPNATLRPFPTMLERAFGIIASLDLDAFASLKIFII